MRSKITDHIRNRSYMSGIDRDTSRIKSTGEVFTPTELVSVLIKQLPIEQFVDPTKTFLDNSCGDGQFLGEVLIRKMENGSTFEEALATIYGVDLMIDNVDECRKRLLCGREDLRHIVEKNIVCYNGLEYDFKFARRKNIEVKHENSERKKIERARKKAEKELERARKKAEKELERARKKAEKEKVKLEKHREKEIPIIERKIRATGIEATEKLVNKELKKLGLPLLG